MAFRDLRSVAPYSFLVLFFIALMCGLGAIARQTNVGFFLVVALTGLAPLFFVYVIFRLLERPPRGGLRSQVLNDRVRTVSEFVEVRRDDNRELRRQAAAALRDLPPAYEERPPPSYEEALSMEDPPRVDKY